MASKFVQSHMRGLQLTDLQQRILDTVMMKKPVLVYRKGAKHGYGCSILSKWLWLHRDFTYFRGPPRYLKQALQSSETKGVVYDMPCAMQHMTAKRNNLLRTIQRTPTEHPVVVFYHGEPPAWLDKDFWTVMDITNEPPPYKLNQ